MIWIAASVGIAFAIGGILKGATGAGAPLVAVPLLTLLLGPEYAITVMAVANLALNTVQAWACRRALLPARFSAVFFGTGMVGIVAGTWVLVALDDRMLSVVVACGALAYVALRLARPGLGLAMETAVRLAPVAGLAAGTLQGASGISAPITLSFLNGMQLPRAAFVATVAGFFGVTAIAQVPALWAAGLLSPDRGLAGLGAAAAILAFMPLGAFLGRRIPPVAFDRIILALLAIIAVRILVGG
ncbi:MAG: sulfite exporter TauE/SafE family protein [Rhodobacteraceae bacterium]|nr:sulfite exporter TauE/SafE family protein [Paracoccaceae bacterium]